MLNLTGLVRCRSGLALGFWKKFCISTGEYSRQIHNVAESHHGEFYFTKLSNTGDHMDSHTAYKQATTLIALVLDFVTLVCIDYDRWQISGGEGSGEIKRPKMCHLAYAHFLDIPHEK